ncbi:YecA family protein [Anaeromicropila herbilytica]|uniref:SEC-C motif-containing protein n=1 Tax=Anaeromicropila herbilytica TaxID=2785025 RepID=A0A7R7ICH4_9FIRM|nr:SEC-C metal-binding domain-containing protein [Anaeromicropila herbilytica]BCN30738.1 hypothetical protein bsdtb5_20330 [Anaeromicropila herbilytica]
MKEESINKIIEAYENNELNECSAKLFLLVLLYNTDIMAGEPYDHDLKHILFKTNCIRNPIGMKYNSNDYKKTKQILMDVFNMSKAINDPKINTQDTFQKDLAIDDRIIKDIINMVVYTDCFYKMNSVNTKRMDESETSKISFVEQLITVLLFYQDQTRIFRENYQNFLSKDCVTGMELSVTNRPVDYYDNLNVSISDNFESTLESINEIVHYLYYQYGENLATQVIETGIKFELIQPYKNVEFERYLYIASQRYHLCRIEEGIRYGYYEIGHMNTTEEGLQVYSYSLENDEKYKARSIGIFRREYQVRNHTMFDYRNQKDLALAYEKLPILADDLINVQAEENVILDFSKFHPDKDLFQKAEGIAKSKERIVESLTKDYYLECNVKGVKIRDLLCTYEYLNTLSEILYFASMKIIIENEQNTYVKELSLIDLSYLSMELSRIHSFDISYAQKLIDRFVFHEKKNRDDDIFAQPLLKISKTQVVLSQALLDQVNLDRFIERQFIRYKKDVSEIGHIFEKEFIDRLKKGYSERFFDFKYKVIPNFAVNTNEVKYEAFDGREIEFDVISVLGDYLILTELKAVMTSYDLNDLEERKRNVKKAIVQLKRRAESVKYDWEKIRELVSIDLPDQPYDQDHIILIACTDTYDYTPLKYENIFITDDSSYLKYFTNPYVDTIELKPGNVTVRNSKNIWKRGYPDAQEFIEYLMNPVTIHPFSDYMKKRYIPIPVIDEKDCAIFCEEYNLVEDPIKAAVLSGDKDGEQTVKRTVKKIYPNDPCPCGSGKKYKNCCRNNAK